MTEINLPIIIFILVLIAFMAKGLFGKIVPTALKAVGFDNGETKGGTPLPKTKEAETWFHRKMRRSLGTMILYIALLIILMMIPRTAAIIREYHLYVALGIVAMILPSVFLEYRQSKDEKLKDQKRLNLHFFFLVIFILSLVIGMRLGWIGQITEMDIMVEKIEKSQTVLTLKPIKERLIELSEKATKKVLSSKERQEVYALKKKSKKLRLAQREPIWPFNKKGDKKSPKKVTSVSAQKWQLCWEKLPEERGVTSKRRDCTPARIIRKDKVLIAEYNLSGGGKGRISADKTNGAYRGRWSDKWNEGSIQLRFTSNTSSYGWVKGERTGVTPATLSTM